MKKLSSILITSVRQNQKIRTLAREADPDGKRCLGVLTKPDKIEEGTEDTVIDMLRGDIYQLQWGYFIVRCPRQGELMKLKEMANLTEAEKEVSSCCGTNTPEGIGISGWHQNVLGYTILLLTDVLIQIFTRSGATLRTTTSVLMILGVSCEMLSLNVVDQTSFLRNFRQCFAT